MTLERARSIATALKNMATGSLGLIRKESAERAFHKLDKSRTKGDHALAQIIWANIGLAT